LLKGFTSTSYDEDKALEFATNVLFEIELNEEIKKELVFFNVEDFSIKPEEKEVLFLNSIFFTIKKKSKKEN